jgi:hypothetical protein
MWNSDAHVLVDISIYRRWGGSRRGRMNKGTKETRLGVGRREPRRARRGGEGVGRAQNGPWSREGKVRERG